MDSDTTCSVFAAIPSPFCSFGNFTLVYIIVDLFVLCHTFGIAFRIFVTSRSLPKPPNLRLISEINFDYSHLQ